MSQTPYVVTLVGRNLTRLVNRVRNLESNNFTDIARRVLRLESLAQYSSFDGSAAISGNILTTATATQSVTVTGAVVGDFVRAGLSVGSLSSLILSGVVSATDTVIVSLYNPTGGTVVQSGTLYVRVQGRQAAA